MNHNRHDITRTRSSWPQINSKSQERMHSMPHLETLRKNLYFPLTVRAEVKRGQKQRTKLLSNGQLDSNGRLREYKPHSRQPENK